MTEREYQLIAVNRKTGRRIPIGVPDSHARICNFKKAQNANCIYNYYEIEETKTNRKEMKMSWIIVEKDTRKAVMETYEPAVHDAVNTDKYKAVTALEYLNGLNRGVYSK